MNNIIDNINITMHLYNKSRKVLDKIWGKNTFSGRGMSKLGIGVYLEISLGGRQGRYIGEGGGQNDCWERRAKIFLAYLSYLL